MRRLQIGLRRYNLRLDLIVIALAGALMFAVILLAQRAVDRQFIATSQNDINKFSVFFSGHLELTENEFIRWAQAQALSDFPPAAPAGFSDLYRLNADNKIEEIFKASRKNALYEGFVFSRGPLLRHLPSTIGSASMSPILRGYEDEQPSLYFSYRIADELLLGRIDLGYFETLLSRYTAFSGQPVFVSTAAGIVMLTSDRSVQLPIIPGYERKQRLPEQQRLVVNGNERLAVTRLIPELGAPITLLVSTQFATQLKAALWLTFGAIFIGMVILTIIKNERIATLIIQPLERLSSRIDALAANKSPSPLPMGDYRIRELADLDLRFTEMTRDVKKRETALIQAEKAKGDFLANMSHEIRSPLSVILGMNDLLLQQELPPAAIGKLQHISDSGRYLLRVINEVLDLSKIEAGRMELKNDAFNLRKLILRVTEQTQSLLKPEVTLKTNISLTTDHVVGDSLRLEQVLTNLLDNAVKFTESGQITLRCDLTKKTDIPQARLYVEVEDTGIGVEKAQLGRLFDSFTQADSSINRPYAGTGLGLAISKQLVELMGGRIFVKSEIHKGSIFGFELSLDTVKDDNEQNLSQSNHPSTLPVSTRILVVDDSAVIRMVVTELLTSIGCEVDSVETAELAIARIQSDPDAYNAVLMDIQMPGMDGITATKTLKSEPTTSRVPIIGITAGVLGEQRTRVLAAGAEHVLAKPIDLKALTDALHQVI